MNNQVRAVLQIITAMPTAVFSGALVFVLTWWLAGFFIGGLHGHAGNHMPTGAITLATDTRDSDTRAIRDMALMDMGMRYTGITDTVTTGRVGMLPTTVAVSQIFESESPIFPSRSVVSF